MELVGQPLNEIQIGDDGFGDVGPLDFDCDHRIGFMEPGTMDLSERSSGDRSLVKRSEDVLGVAVQFFDENFANIFEINGRNGVLQFAQFEDKRLGNQVRPHTQQLTKLHPSGTELFGREADAFPF